MNARHIMIPGLCAAQIDAGYIPSLREFRPRQQARLVCSFPATVATVETTLRTGFPALRHGVLFEGESPRVPDLIGAWHSRLDHLVDDPRGGEAALDAELRRILDAHPGNELLLISCAPPAASAPRRIEVDITVPAGFSLRLDDAFALCVADSDDHELPAGTLDGWLGTRGVERVLAPSVESAGAWMAPADRGWILVAEPGWAFRDSLGPFGHSEPERGREALLLAYGPTWTAEWPDSIHDWRVAPTLLAARGEVSDACFDRPLAAAESLGS